MIWMIKKIYIYVISMILLNGFVSLLSQDKATTRAKRTDQYVHYCFKRSSFIISDANRNCIDLFHLLCI